MFFFYSVSFVIFRIKLLIVKINHDDGIRVTSVYVAMVTVSRENKISNCFRYNGMLFKDRVVRQLKQNSEIVIVLLIQRSFDGFAKLYRFLSLRTFVFILHVDIITGLYPLPMTCKGQPLYLRWNR